MNVSLRQLRAFTAVVRLGSFVQAARALSLTQAALSHLVRELESNTGIRLLDRTTRSLRLSKAGEIYLPYAERVLSDLESAARCARDLRDGKLGMVRVATTPLLAATGLPSIIAAYQRTRPEVRITLLDLPSDSLVPRVAIGDADLALGPERPPGKEVASKEVFSDPLVLVCPRTHRFARRRRLRWQELKDEPLIMSGRGAALRTMADLDYAMTIEPAIEVDQFTTTLALVAASQGVCFSTANVRPHLEMYGLRMIPLIEPCVRRRIMLYWHADRTLSPAAGHFAEFMTGKLQNR